MDPAAHGSRRNQHRASAHNSNTSLNRNGVTVPVNLNNGNGHQQFELDKFGNKINLDNNISNKNIKHNPVNSSVNMDAYNAYPHDMNNSSMMN